MTSLSALEKWFLVSRKCSTRGKYSWCKDMRRWDTKTSSTASVSTTKCLSNYKATGKCRIPSNIRMEIMSRSKGSWKSSSWETTCWPSSHTRLSSTFAMKWKSKRRKMSQFKPFRKSSKLVNCPTGLTNQKCTQIVFTPLKMVPWPIFISRLSRRIWSITVKLQRRDLIQRRLK